MQLPNFTDKFSDNLSLLPTKEINAASLFDQSGNQVGKLENKPGQAGSLRVYSWLAEAFGAITPDAAELGLIIYAEHTKDAETNPGKHPNIDRLFSIKTSAQSLVVKFI